MRSKAEIQKKIEELKLQKGSFTKRFEALESKRNAIVASIEGQKKAISKALVDGKEPSKEISSIIASNLELEGTDLAINQVGELVEKLTGQYAEALKEFHSEDLERLSTEADTLLDISLKRFYAAIEDLNAVDEKFREIDQIGAEAGIRVDNENAHIGGLRIIYKSLSGRFHPTDGIPYKLEYIEKNYARVLAEMREKKSG